MSVNCDSGITCCSFAPPDYDAAMRLATAMLGFSSWHEVVLLTRGIVPMFPLYLLIVWFMPNTI